MRAVTWHGSRKASAANNFDPPPRIRLPAPTEIGLESVQKPRDAFFGTVEQIPAAEAADTSLETFRVGAT
jgi:hypothetical protein